MIKKKVLSPFGMRSFRGRNDGQVLDSDWHKTASHWTCVLHHGNHNLSIGYSMGSAHKGEPKVDDVVYSILVDSYAKDMTPRQFCEEYGYDINQKSYTFAKWAISAGKQAHYFMMKTLGKEGLEALQAAFEDY